MRWDEPDADPLGDIQRAMNTFYRDEEPMLQVIETENTKCRALKYEADSRFGHVEITVHLDLNDAADRLEPRPHHVMLDAMRNALDAFDEAADQ